MTNQTPENSQSTTSDNSSNTTRFSLPMFVQKLIQSTLTLLFMGSVLIMLYQFNGAISDYSTLQPSAFVGMAIAIIALTLMGVPVMGAAAAGAAVWLAIQSFFQ